MSILPLLTGVAASLLATLQLAGWLALGSFAIRPTLRPILRPPIALLVGSALTAFVYAILSYMGLVTLAIGLVAAGTAAALLLRWRWVVESIAELGASLMPVLKQRWAAIGIAVIAAMCWLDAIVPPRDADVMRYHLAHIRQIVRDGKWVPLPDYTYGLPFGWTLNYLPFEKVHLPEVAHLLNLGTWILAIAVIAAMLRERRAPKAAFLLLAFATLVPLVLKSATTAFADLYAVFVVFGIALLLSELPDLTKPEMVLLGFVSTVGAQSRYQLLGVSVTVFLVGAIYLARRRIDLASFGAAALGAIAGLVLASPFYVANYLALHNPFWPLMVRQFNGLGPYAHRVAEQVNHSLTGDLTIRDVGRSLRYLLMDRVAFPIPLLAIASVAAPLWSRDRTVRTLALFTAVFLAVWALVQPSLYSRFSVLLIPPIVLGLGLSLEPLIRIRVLKPLMYGGLLAGIAGFFAFDLYYSKDSVRYVATGDADTFHDATWFYPVYQWVNDSTPAQSRFLVIVASSHSYYLDKAYRKAEPFMSGYIDWEAVHSTSDLDGILQCSGFEYVIYDTWDWTKQVGGKRLDAVMQDAVRDGTLRMVREFKLRMVTSRVNGAANSTIVWVLRRGSTTPSADCRGVRARQPFID